MVLATILLFLSSLALETQPTYAFVNSPSVVDRNSVVSTFSQKKASQVHFFHHAILKRRSPLYSTLSRNETSSAFPYTVSESVTTNTVFPRPPAPPTDEELHSQGLPILVEAAKHAKAGRTMCYELPENGCVGISYRTVLRDAAKIADYIANVTESGKLSNNYKPRTVAHLTEPGSEYLSSMWGVSQCWYQMRLYSRVIFVMEICVWIFRSYFCRIISYVTDMGSRILYRTPRNQSSWTWVWACPSRCWSRGYRYWWSRHTHRRRQWGAENIHENASSTQWRRVTPSC